MNRTDSDIEIILIAWIRLALGDSSFSVIVGNQRGKEPAGSYASILAMISTSVGMGAMRSGLIAENVFGYDGSGDSYDQNVLYNQALGTIDFALVSSSIRDVTFSIDFFRNDAHENMRRLMHFPNTNTSQEFMFDKSISLFVPDGYRNLDDLEGDGFIKRAQIDLRLHCASEYGETVNAIDEVDLTVEI